jgi:non-heme chloroperoxidase
MTRITLGSENSRSLELHYDDEGMGRPIVLIHGWPQASECWAQQRQSLLAAGYRVISYDRRGSGRSSPTSLGHDYDTYAEDLQRLLTTLDLREVALVGFSMGAGEVVRYLGTYGEERIRRAVLIAPLPPFLLKTADNPGGLDGDAIDRTLAAMDHSVEVTTFSDFREHDCVEDQALLNSFPANIRSSGIAMIAALWRTDFRDDMPRINVPTLVIHGGADPILPLQATGQLLAEGIEAARLVLIDEATHGLLWTHAEQVNSELLGFLA